MGWVIVSATGDILAECENEDAAREALLTGDYPDDASPAYVN